MTIHVRHPAPQERKEFLVDGCPRCAEYVRDLGLPFDEQRFCEFWEKMLQVEYVGMDNYASKLDEELGRNLYRVSLALQRAFGLDPHALTPRGITSSEDAPVPWRCSHGTDINRALCPHGCRA